MARYSSDSDLGRPRRAVVVGGSRGVGLATARALGKEGWKVTIASRSQEQLDRAVQSAHRDGIPLAARTVDVTCESSVTDLFRELGSTGSLDLCVSAAGANLSQRLVRKGRDGHLKIHSLLDWNHTIQLCLTGVFLCGREAAALMISRATQGVIVNISSVVHLGSFGQSAYAAAKSGIVSLTRSWALELADYGIRVVCIAPGVIDGEALQEKCRRYSGHAAYMEALRQHIPLRRWAHAQEVAEAVEFAARHRYLTGTTIEVHGGGLPPRVLAKQEMAPKS